MNSSVSFPSDSSIPLIISFTLPLDSIKDILKKEVKELIYEEYRALKALLEAHSNGLLCTRIVKFKDDKDATA